MRCPREFRDSMPEPCVCLTMVFVLRLSLQNYQIVVRIGSMHLWHFALINGNTLSCCRQITHNKCGEHMAMGPLEFFELADTPVVHPSLPVRIECA